jgi:hypothetical protein
MKRAVQFDGIPLVKLRASGGAAGVGERVHVSREQLPPIAVVQPGGQAGPVVVKPFRTVEPLLARGAVMKRVLHVASQERVVGTVGKAGKRQARPVVIIELSAVEVGFPGVLSRMALVVVQAVSLPLREYIAIAVHRLR